MPYRLNPFTGELDIVLGPGEGGASTEFDTDSGTAFPTGAGVITMAGGTGINTSASGSTVTFNLDDPVIVDNGGTGRTSLTDGAILVGDGSNPVEMIGPLTDGQLLIGDTAGISPVAASLTAGTGITITNAAGSITLDASSAVPTSFPTDSGTATPAANVLNIVSDETIATSGAGNSVTVSLSANTKTSAVNGWNGSLLETASVTVTSDGVTITCSVEKSGGGNLTAIFSTGYYNWTTAPDTVTLAEGLDTAPLLYYVYLLESTKVLTASTVGWPGSEHAPICTTIVQSAASLQTDGPYKVHVWTDHVTATDNQGHVGDLNFWIRQQPATWVSSVVQSYNIVTNGGSADNVNIDTTAGVVLQLHDHTFPAFTTVHDYYVINDSVTPYNVVTDLNALLTDSTGASMSGKYFSLVLWGVVSEDTGDCKIMVNLPSGSYNNSASLTADVSGFANFSIPGDYTGTGFLISQWNLRHQAASGGTWTSIDEIDLRGLVPSINPGGTTAAETEFPDNLFRVFDNSDDTKKIAFEVSSVTTATTRTITAADYDIDLATVCISAPTDSGTATPALGALTFAGTNGIAISGAGSTVTIDGSSITDFDWNVETGTSAAMSVNNGYIGNNAGTVTFTLPDTAAVGDMIRVTGLQGAWVIAQNAGDTIHFGDQDTTTGAGGSLASTDSRDAVELVCVVANTNFQVLSSVGNITVT